MNIKLKVKKINPKIGKHFPEPTYATPASAGLDLCAAVDSPVTIKPGSIERIPTGVAVQLPDNTYVGLVFVRSGLAVKYGLSLVNSVGVIDADYTGEIICPLINQGAKEVALRPGDRIAQLVCVSLAVAEIEYVSELRDTQRGSGGFGSTGR